jgi:Fibronectin type III domain
LLLVAASGGLFSSAAVVIPPGGLAAAPSGKDLILSFTTTSPKFYIVQTSPDLQQWTNCPAGVPGDGTTKSVTVTNALLSRQAFYRFVSETPTSLVLPQSTAFEILGYSCGGIKEQVSAGISVTNGYPTGVVDVSTTCSGSGRGGHSTTHAAAALVTWDFAGNVVSAVVLSNGVTVGTTTSTDGHGDNVYNAGTAAYLIVPTPGAPTSVIAVQSGDQFNVSWGFNGVSPDTIISSTVTATPINSTAPVLTTTVSGMITSGTILSLEPQTTYQITVVNATISGPGPASAPIRVTTAAATIPPSAPAVVTASWLVADPSGDTDTIEVSWEAANPGNSPVDEYLVTIVGSDGGGTDTQTVSGTTLTASFNVNDVPNWSVTVQAHNAAGWGPVSSAVKLGGL